VLSSMSVFWVANWRVRNPATAYIFLCISSASGYYSMRVEVFWWPILHPSSDTRYLIDSYLYTTTVNLER
jgi:hypothetical protein